MEQKSYQLTSNKHYIVHCVGTKLMQTLPKTVAGAAMWVMAVYLAITICPTQNMVSYDGNGECQALIQWLKEGYRDFSFFFFKGLIVCWKLCRYIPIFIWLAVRNLDKDSF